MVKKAEVCTRLSLDLNVFLKSFTKEKVSPSNESIYALLEEEYSSRNMNKSLKLRRQPKIRHTIFLTNSGNKFRNIKCQKHTHIPHKSKKLAAKRIVKSNFLKYSFAISFPPNIKNCAIAYGNKNVFIVDCKRRI